MPTQAQYDDRSLTDFVILIPAAQAMTSLAQNSGRFACYQSQDRHHMLILGAHNQLYALINTR